MKCNDEVPSGSSNVLQKETKWKMKLAKTVLMKYHSVIQSGLQRVKKPFSVTLSPPYLLATIVIPAATSGVITVGRLFLQSSP